MRHKGLRCSPGTGAFVVLCLGRVLQLLRRRLGGVVVRGGTMRGWGLGIVRRESLVGWRGFWLIEGLVRCFSVRIRLSSRVKSLRF